MNLKSQLVIDKTIVKFSVQVLNIFVRILGKILKINHSLDQDFKVFAICKFKGLGSIIQATPLIQTIKKNYPQARIIFITTESNRILVQPYPEIDEVITLNDSSSIDLILGFFPFVYRLLKGKIDNYFDLEIYSNFSTLVTTLSMATNRFGYYLRSSHYRLGVYTHMMYYNIDSPISQTYLQLIRAFPIKGVTTDLKKPTYTASDWLKTFEIENDNYILINPNASDLRLERRWETEKFVSLIGMIQSKFPTQKIVLVGSQTEENYVNKLVSKISIPVVNTAGKTSITGLFQLIENAKLVITNDSGPMHIAFAFQKTTISLFGPCSPEQYGYHHFSIPVYKKIYCSPCVHEFDISPCNGNNQCMKLIEVTEVFAHVENILNGHFKPASHSSRIIFEGKDHWVPGFVNR